MTKKKKRLLGILLSFALVIGMMPALGMTQTAYAETKDIAVGTVYSQGDAINFGNGAYVKRGSYTNNINGTWTVQRIFYSTDLSAWRFDIQNGSSGWGITCLNNDTNTEAPSGVKCSGGDGTQGNPYTFITYRPTHTHDTPWDKTDSLPDKAGNYYLTDDVTLTGTWTVPTDGAVNLCLNGKSISEGNSKDFKAITIPKNAVLNLYDEEENAGKITGIDGKNLIGAVIVEGTFKMYGGQINGNTLKAAPVYVAGGDFTMEGGAITNNKANSHAAGMFIEGGTFTMSAGSISENSFTSNSGIGGGVYQIGGTFTMSGGTIANNTSTGNGGGVYQSGGTFTMSDGTIANNICTGDRGGGGVFKGSGTFNLNGGAITGNKAVGTGGIYSDGTISLSGAPTIKGNMGGCTKETGGELTGGSASNVFLPYSGSLISIEGELTNTDAIGISKVSPGVGVFTKSAEGVKASEYKDKFISESGDSNLVIKTEGDELKIAQSEAVKYLDADGEEKTVDTYGTMYDVGSGNITGWYVVDKDLTLSKRPTAYGELNLILSDGVTLTLKQGLDAKKNNKVILNIYAQSTGENAGKLIATGSNNYYAGIGGNGYGAVAGTINIYGGNITAIGGGSAPGIGSGYYTGLDGGGQVNIYGGTVTAKGGNNAAGIGGSINSNGGTVNVYGGEITAEGGDYAAGIGAGNNSSASQSPYNGGKFNIYDGSVKAVGGRMAAGIGGGKLCEGATVRINGGSIEAIAGEKAEGSTEAGAAAIGAGERKDDHGLVLLGKNINVLAGDDAASATDVTATFADKHDQVYAKTVTRQPISAKVTFKVANGSWNEGEGDAATADKEVALTGLEGDTLKLAADQIPAVGSKPAEGYKAGSWDTEPSTETAITADTTYTYTYAAREASDDVADLINALPNEVKATDKEAVATAKKAYDELTPEQQKKVPAEVLAKLNSAKTVIEALDSAATAEAAAADAQKAKEAAEKAKEDAEKIAEQAGKDSQAAKEAQAKAEAAQKVAEDKAAAAEAAKEKAEKAKAKAKAAEKAAKKAAKKNSLTPLAKTKGVKVKGAKRKMTVKWKKVKKAKGYQIVVSKDKKGTEEVQYYKVKGAKKTRKVIEKLRWGEYYVKVRAYKRFKGNTVYGKFSKVKHVRVR